MPYNISSLRYEYQLLYLRTFLLSNAHGFSSFSRLRFENNLSFSHQFNIERLFGKKPSKLRKFKNFSHVLSHLNVPSDFVSFIKKYRSSFVNLLIRNLKKIKFRSFLRSNSLATYNFSFLFPLRLLNLRSKSSICSLVRKENASDRLKQLYSSFLFLYPSCANDEIRLTSFLRFLFSDYAISNFFSSDSLLLNRFMINSFFFSRKKRLLKVGKSKKASRILKLISKRRFSFYKRSKILLCSFFDRQAKRKVGHIKRKSVGPLLFSKLLRYRRGFYIRYRKALRLRRFKFYKSSRSVARLHNITSLNYDSLNLHSFVSSLNRLVHRCFIVKLKPFSSSMFSTPKIRCQKSNVLASTNSLFTFYKKHQSSKLRRFIKRVRGINKMTYNLHLNETGSNIYSTFMHKNKMLFSMWSGRFGLKKRLKYRKKAGHKISHHFHRFISNMYKKKEIAKLNFIVKGFPKFFEICLEALSRQIAYSQNYHLNLRKHRRLLRGAARISSSILWKSFKNRWSSSFLKSFTLPLVSSSVHVNLNSSDINLLIPELSSNDVVLLNKVINNDNSLRSDLLMRVLRTRRYKRNLRLLNPSSDYNRSLLVNKLIGIFMVRYSITSKKDFYRAVSYLNKYKSSILNYPYLDKSDFMSAYAIIYILKILKQNRLYFSKLVSSFLMLRRKFTRYSKKIRFFALRSLYRKSKSRSYYKSSPTNKINVKKTAFRSVIANRYKNNSRTSNFKKNSFLKSTYRQKNIINIKKNKKFKTPFARLSSYVKRQLINTNTLRSSVKGFSVISLFNFFCNNLLRSYRDKLKIRLKSRSKLKLKLKRKRQFRKLLRKLLVRTSKHQNYPFVSALKKRLMCSFISFVRRFSCKYYYTLSSSARNKLFNYFLVKKLDSFFGSKSKSKAKSKSKFNTKFLSSKRKRRFKRNAIRSLKKSLIRASLFKLLNSFMSMSPSFLHGVSSSRRLINSKLKRSKLARLKLKRSRFLRNVTRRSLLLRRLRLRRARSLIFRKKRRRISARSRMHLPRKKYWMFLSKTYKKARTSTVRNRINNQRKVIIPRFKYSSSLRSIRTRMRNFIRLSTTFGYVKCRSSLSHGGCSSRKRSYDKRYIF